MGELFSALASPFIPAIFFTRGTGWRRGWENSPPTNVVHYLNPGVDAICRVSLLLVLSFSPRGFFPCTRFSPLLKNQHSKFSLTRNQVDEEPLSGCATSKSKSLFIYSFTYSFIYLSISRIIKISCMNCYDVRFWRPSLYQFKRIDKKYLRFQVRFENPPFS